MSPGANHEDWRVAVQLSDEEHGYSLSERLRAVDLDDEARRRLGAHVVVTRRGSALFLYTSTEAHAREAAKTVKQLVDSEHLTADIATTHWNPSEEEWQDVNARIGDRSGASATGGREARDERERAEAREEGAFDWYVHVATRSRDEAAALEKRLGQRALETHRRWSHVTLVATTEADAHELASIILDEFPHVEVEVEPYIDLPPPLFVLVRSLI